MGKRIPTLIGLLLVAITAWLSITHIPSVQSFITDLASLAYDIQLSARTITHFVPPKSPIVIIDIDDKSLTALGRWPWPRSELGLLIDKLHEAGVVVIALD